MKKSVIIGVTVGVVIAGLLLAAFYVWDGVFDYLTGGSPTEPIRRKLVPFGWPPGSRVHYGFINHQGKLVIPAQFDDASSFHQGRCAVRIDQKWGFVDSGGQLIIPARFVRVHDFSEGLAAAREGRDWGFIDRSGNWVISPTWKSVGDFQNGICVVSLRTRRGIIDRSGKYLLQPGFCVIDKESDGARRFRRYDRGRYGFVDKNGRLIVDAKFQDATQFSEEVAAVRDENDKWGFIDKSGALVIPASFDHCGLFNHGLAAASQNGKFGLIDHSGRFVMPPKYTCLSAMYFKAGSPPVQCSTEGFTPIAYNNRWGFASSTTGKVLIEPNYAEVDTFSEGVARVGLFDDPKAVPLHEYGNVSDEQQSATQPDQDSSSSTGQAKPDSDK